MSPHDRTHCSSDRMKLDNDLKDNPRRIEYYSGKARLSAFTPEEVSALLAFRFGVISGRKGLDVTQILTCRLGSLKAATHMHRLMTSLANIWEGPFMVAPPCSRTVTLDEAIMCQMLRCAMADNRTQFENVIGPLLTSKSIPATWRLFRNVAESLLDRHKA